MLEMTAYTDGSCLGNPGVGGYAAIMIAKGQEKPCVGYEKDDTTNNRMELRAVINVVKWCNRVQKEPCKVTFCVDSQYLIDCYKHGFSDLASKSRPNHDLWIELIRSTLDGGHEISFVKVKGHNGNKMNEKVDKLAKEQALKARHERFGI